MIAACCVKSAQTVNRMRALVQEGITEKDWTEALVKRSFEVPIERRPEDTPLTMGEFDIVKALLAKCPEVGVGKILVDKMVDLAGPGPDGAGTLTSGRIDYIVIVTIAQWESALGVGAF